MRKLKARVDKKIEKYTNDFNEKKLRKYHRELWAINGMLVEGFEFSIVLKIFERYVELDLVPKHYDYPEFYFF